VKTKFEIRIKSMLFGVNLRPELWRQMLFIVLIIEIRRRAIYFYTRECHSGISVTVLNAEFYIYKLTPDQRWGY